LGKPISKTLKENSALRDYQGKVVSVEMRANQEDQNLREASVTASPPASERISM
jgi:hypothetical protein